MGLKIEIDLSDAGTMGARIQAHDWSGSPPGPPEIWSASLLVTLSNMLRSKFPTCVAWGPELIIFYNDAYLALRGTRPEALGRPLPQAWAEFWNPVSAFATHALRGEAAYVEDVPVGVVQRHGYPEETWWTASFSPIMEDSRTVGGILITLQETTERVRTEQRLRFLVDLSTRLRGVAQAQDVMTTAAEMLGSHLKASRVGYAEHGESGRALAVECDWTDAGIPASAEQHRVSDFGQLIESELRAGRTIRIDDVLADPLTAEETIAAEFLRTNRRASIIAPLIRDGRFVAALYVHQAEPRHWR
ncbi:GAF domain-containing protein, partial [Microvirga aerophila]